MDNKIDNDNNHANEDEFIQKHIYKKHHMLLEDGPSLCDNIVTASSAYILSIHQWHQD